jgi:ribosomal protein S18 acetylase RimI-like enzyme
MIALLPMSATDLPEVLELWANTEGVGLNESDNVPALGHFLQRNPGLSRIAREDQNLVAAVLCGHDGRRGFLYHLAVSPEHRRQGLGKKLVELCLASLAAQGIQKCNALVYCHNASGRRFWEQIGFRRRDDLDFWQRATS